MKDIVLSRFVNTPYITLGKMYVGVEEFYTVERPDLDNQRNVSCIPEGFYVMRRHNSPKFGDRMWEIVVPDRSYILIHAANEPHEVEGCIGLGMTVHDNLMGVGASRLAVKTFYDYTAPWEEARIHIREETICQ